MARVPYIEVKEHPELNELVAKIGSQRAGQLSPLYGLLLYSPPVAEGWLHMITAVRQQTQLTKADQELVLMLVAVINKALYEYKNHAPQALAAGLTQAQIDAIPDWKHAKDKFDAHQLAVLAYADVMSREVEVPEPVFAGVREIFDTRKLVELTALVSAYNMVTRFSAAMKLGS